MLLMQFKCQLIDTTILSHKNSINDYYGECQIFFFHPLKSYMKNLPRTKKASYKGPLQAGTHGMDMKLLKKRVRARPA